MVQYCEQDYLSVCPDYGHTVTAQIVMMHKRARLETEPGQVRPKHIRWTSLRVTCNISRICRCTADLPASCTLEIYRRTVSTPNYPYSANHSGRSCASSYSRYGPFMNGVVAACSVTLFVICDLCVFSPTRLVFRKKTKA